MSSRNKLCLALFGTFIAAILAGCTQRYSFGVDLPQEKLDRIVAGQTTRQGVIVILGEPKDIVTLDTSTNLIYESVTAEVAHEIAKMSTRRLTVVLDESEVVRGRKIELLYREVLHSSCEDSGTRHGMRTKDRD